MTPIHLPIAELKPALQGLGKVLNKTATLPVLSMIKVERTTEGWIALTATDLDSFATVRLEQPDQGEPMSVLVLFTELQSLVKTCAKNDTIGVSPIDDQVVLDFSIGTQRTGKRCDTIPVPEFPEIPRIKGEPIPIPDSVRTAFQEAFECASTDETRLVLNGAYLDVSDSKCHCIVGTDGRHLYASNSFHLPLQSSVIIPTHRFLGWKEFNNDGEWRMKVQEGALVQLSTRRWRFITKQFDGLYPNWRQVIPKEAGQTTVEIEACDSLVQTINRIPDHDPNDHKIGVSVEHGVLVLLGKASAEDSQFIHVPVPGAKVTGPDVRVQLNREFLVKALSFGLGSFSIEDALSPLKFTNGGRQMIVMPVRTGAEPVPPANVETKPVESPVAGEATNGVSELNPTNERKQPMPESTQEPQSMDQIFDEVLSGIESTRESLVEKAVHLKSLGSKVKLLMREQKSSMKEIQAIRQTLKSLQGVRL